ncbi:MAG: endonuclease/exonuclease/phosphatase family protein [Bacteroidia bacterium]|nr:endonuclease/exonuclease/phosphatase family protein [Bacteroidia bacterium]
MLFVLVLLSWFIPPWIWSVPMGVSLFWPYVGGFLLLWGLWRDRAYWIFWGALGANWVFMVSFLWQLVPSGEVDGEKVRVGTFNMDGAHYDRKQIERLIDSLGRWHPQVLCMQEVYLGDYSAATFARRMGYRHHVFLDAGRQMGMLVLSDFPVLSSATLTLLSGSTNGIQQVQLLLPRKQTVSLYHVHFPSYRLGTFLAQNWAWFTSVWEFQRRFSLVLETALSRTVDPVWICGDFNAMPFHPLYRRLAFRLYDSFRSARIGEGPTWRYPFLRIDYIWSSMPVTGYKVRWIPRQSHGYVEVSIRTEGVK